MVESLLRLDVCQGERVKLSAGVKLSGVTRGAKSRLWPCALQGRDEANHEILSLLIGRLRSDSTFNSQQRVLN